LLPGGAGSFLFSLAYAPPIKTSENYRALAGFWISGNRSFVFTSYNILLSTIKLRSILYMIIEKFHPGKVKDLYKRSDETGRMPPEGVK